MEDGIISVDGSGVFKLDIYPDCRQSIRLYVNFSILTGKETGFINNEWNGEFWYITGYAKMLVMNAHI